MYIVYKHTLPNKKVYIGITSRNPIKRWSAGNGYKTQTYFYRAIQKYGWNNIKHEILFTDLTKEEACEKEIELIAFYKSNNPDFGYNNSIGGENGRAGIHLSDEYRKKLSEANKGKHPSEDTREKMRKARKGRKPALGMKHTDETKMKMSAVHSRPVVCLENGHTFKSAVEAMIESGVDCSCITKTCRGERKTAGGLHWEYIA